MRKAILIIHGFAGGTYDQENIANLLELDGFHVFSFTLPGHERTMFKKVTKEDWIESCINNIEELINNGYKRIYLIGHSMGGVLACLLASKYKEVKKIVLAAPAFKYMTFDKDEFEFINALKNSPKLLKYYSKGDMFARAIQFPRSVIKEFMDLVSESQDLPKKVMCPVLILHGTEDQIVPLKSSEHIINEFPNSNKKLIPLEGYTHDIFRGNDLSKIKNKIERFFNKII